MNEQGVTQESEFILRRLGEAFPLNPGTLADGLLRRIGEVAGVELLALTGVIQVLLVLLFVAASLGCVAWLYRTDTRFSPHGAFPLAVLRLIAFLLVGIAIGFPQMSTEAVTLHLFGSQAEIGPVEHAAWLFFVSGVLLFGLCFVVGGYLRDTQTIRWFWAVPLAGLRASVYVLLAGAFLLPAVQTWEKTEKRSRVVVILDISPSVTRISDDLSRDSTIKPKTRIEKLLDYLMDDKIDFLQRILEKNPVTVYRFGTRLDEESQVFSAEQPLWSREEWLSWVQYDFKPWILQGLSPAGREAVQASPHWKPDQPGTTDWAVTWAKLPGEEAIPQSLSPADATVLQANRGRLEKRIDVARSIILGTNVADAMISAINREAANMVQGIIIFTDGRSNLGGSASLNELEERAVREKIPLFTVALGQPRENIGIQITDLQVPDRAGPDEQFKVVVEADGVGLSNQEVEVQLDLFLPSRDPKKDQADHTVVQKLVFQPGEPPHGQAEFVIDPEAVPELLTEASKKIGKNRQLKQGEWHLVARIARDRREIFSEPFHASPPRALQVIDKPIRVLLFAGGPSREYLTLLPLFVREVDAKRAELSVCLQTEGGREGTAVQSVPPERLLNKFPTRLDTTNKATDRPEDKYYNLNEYDLIVAFDPDWSELSEDQIKNLQSWVDNLGGGFVFVAGPIYSFQLARAAEDGRLKPLLDILPVLPDDIILLKTRPVPRTPRRLLLKPNPDFDVLKLTEGATDDPAAGWESYFTGREKLPPGSDLRSLIAPKEGIFSYYPVKLTKPGSITLAEFLDVNDRGDPDPKPWLVTTQPVRGRTAFMGSGEIYRLRAEDPEYYERFWIKLARYISTNRDVKASRGRVLMGKEFISGAPIRVQARLLNPSGRPYGENELDPKFKIVAYNSIGEPLNKQFGPFPLKAKKSASGFDGYYTGQVLADPRQLPPGDFRYQVVVDVPDSPGDTISSEFIVRRSDPELDETRPDFALLEAIASPVNAVESRIKNADTVTALRGAVNDSAQAKLAFRLSEPERLGWIPECLETKFQNSRNRGPVEDLWDKPLALHGLGIEASLLDMPLTPRTGFVAALIVTILAGVLALLVLVSILTGHSEWGRSQIPLASVILVIGLLGVAGIVSSYLWEFDYHVQIGALLLIVVGLLSAEWATRKLLRLA
ncbi:MAG: hypothetical protein LC104_18110 [Bacteroidales bacterium]|nr:hypothetical protein [Bacteroidales bacterium]